MAEAPPAIWRVRIRTYVNGVQTATDWSPDTLRLTFHKAQARAMNLFHGYDVDGYDCTSMDSTLITCEKANVEKRLQLVSD